MAQRLGARRWWGWCSVAAVALVSPTSAGAIDYRPAPGVEISALSLQMKEAEEGPVCYVVVTIRNGTGKDQVFEISIETDEGIAITTYTGGNQKKPLAANGSETADFKTVLKRLPKDVAVAVKPWAP